MEERFNKKVDKVLEMIDIPKEVSRSFPKITIIGKEEIKIENHKGVLKFEDNGISINTKAGKINIDGTGLELLCIEEETIVIKGSFKAVYYGERE